MKEQNQFIEKTFDELRCDDTKLSDERKEQMLHSIIASVQENSASEKKTLKSFITEYPWRVAFLISTAQAVVCTLLFGSRYTMLVLSLFGGK